MQGTESIIHNLFCNNRKKVCEWILRETWVLWSLNGKAIGQAKKLSLKFSVQVCLCGWVERCGRDCLVAQKETILTLPKN